MNSVTLRPAPLLLGVTVLPGAGNAVISVATYRFDGGLVSSTFFEVSENAIKGLRRGYSLCIKCWGFIAVVYQLYYMLVHIFNNVVNKDSRHNQRPTHSILHTRSKNHYNYKTTTTQTFQPQPGLPLCQHVERPSHTFTP